MSCSPAAVARSSGSSSSVQRWLRSGGSGPRPTRTETAQSRYRTFRLSAPHARSGLGRSGRVAPGRQQLSQGGWDRVGRDGRRGPVPAAGGPGGGTDWARRAGAVGGGGGGPGGSAGGAGRGRRGSGSAPGAAIHDASRSGGARRGCRVRPGRDPAALTWHADGDGRGKGWIGGTRWVERRGSRP